MNGCGSRRAHFTGFACIYSVRARVPRARLVMQKMWLSQFQRSCVTHVRLMPFCSAPHLKRNCTAARTWARSSGFGNSHSRCSIAFCLLITAAKSDRAKSASKTPERVDLLSLHSSQSRCCKINPCHLRSGKAQRAAVRLQCKKAACQRM